MAGRGILKCTAIFSTPIITCSEKAWPFPVVIFSYQLENLESTNEVFTCRFVHPSYLRLPLGKELRDCTSLKSVPVSLLFHSMLTPLSTVDFADGVPQLLLICGRYFFLLSIFFIILTGNFHLPFFLSHVHPSLHPFNHRPAISYLHQLYSSTCYFIHSTNRLRFAWCFIHLIFQPSFHSFIPSSILPSYPLFSVASPSSSFRFSTDVKVLRNFIPQRRYNIHPLSTR